MDIKKRVMKSYYLLALIIGILSLIYDLLIIINKAPIILSTTISIGIIILFLFSIIALGIFHHKHVHGKVYILPIYYILSNIIFFLLGLFIVLKNYNPLILEILSILSSIFIIGFSVYILKTAIAQEPTGPIESSESS